MSVKPRTIVFIIENETYGGGERLFEDIIRRLDPARYAPLVACKPDGVFAGRVRGHARVLPFSFAAQVNPSAFFRLGRLMRETGADIVVSQGSRADFYARIAGRISGVPAVYSIVAMLPEAFDVSPLKRAAYSALGRFSERFADRIFVPTEALREKLVTGHGLPAARVEVIPNGIDVRAFAPAAPGKAAARTSLSLPAEGRLVGSVSRLVWQKGLSYLIEALPLLFAFPGMSDVTAVIAGDGPEREALAARAGALGVGKRVLFPGFCGRVPDLLGALDVFALPSVLEGQPLGVIEAMAAAKPIVASDIDGVRETVKHGETGMLVPPRDPRALAEALRQVLSDPGRAASMGTAARRDAEARFDIETIARRYTAAFDRAPVRKAGTQ